jgi:hypothetical protein
MNELPRFAGDWWCRLGRTKDAKRRSAGGRS